jgi:hypothetical protein
VLDDDLFDLDDDVTIVGANRHWESHRIRDMVVNTNPVVICCLGIGANPEPRERVQWLKEGF